MSDRNLGSPKNKDDTLDRDMEAMFDDDRFDPATLNPAGTGNVDVGRKYYRSTSAEYSSAQVLGEEGRGSIGTESPIQGHDKQEFPQAKSIMSKHKKKSGHKKHRRPSTQPDLPSIPAAEDDDESSGEELADSTEASLPWKAQSIHPVLDSEHHKGGAGEKEDAGEEKPEKKGAAGVKFTLGQDLEDEEEEPEVEDVSGHRQYHRQGKKHSKAEENWKRVGTDVKGNKRPSVVTEDAKDLKDYDVEDIDTHRFEKAAGLGRHKIKKVSQSFSIDLDQYADKGGQGGRGIGFGFLKDVDHTPHHLFVEMDELEGEEWVEKARWIKYEEDIEADVGRWGKAHISSLSFRSLLNLRKCLERGVLLMDLQEVDLPGVVHRVVEQFSIHGLIEENMKPDILRVLNYRHKHVQPHHNTFRFGLRRNHSNKSLPDSNSNVVDMNGKEKDKDALVLEMDNISGGGLKRSGSSGGGSFRRNESVLEALTARKQDILACLEEGTEGCLTLVGSTKCDTVICAMVRLANSIVMNNTIEVNLPMRFIFILLTPNDSFEMDPHEIGRSFSTLMSNQAFHNVCYGMEEKRELLHAINIFLDESVVLPPGDYNRQKLIAMADIMDLRKRRKDRNAQAAMSKAAGAGGGDGPQEPPQEKTEKEEEDKEPPKRNPLERTRVPFGGLINDIKYRYPQYLSDLKDGINPQCIAAIIFIYFAALSGAVAFGGLMGAKTDNDIGIPETLIMSSVAGILFALFAGCPLIIIGTTGPVLLYDEALFGFCKSNGIEFLPWRIWIGIWCLIIGVLIAAFQGSTLVKYFTRFTKDIFASLVSLLFIYEALRKLYLVFQAHPLLVIDDYCDGPTTVISQLTTEGPANLTERVRREIETAVTEASPQAKTEGPKPNTALLSAILMFGTFFIAYFLRIFRNSQYLGRNARRALGDFGVPIAIVIMVCLDIAANDTYTEKLNVPEGLTVSNSTKRDWLIPPTGLEIAMPIWAPFGALIPAILLYLLLFMETHICELIMLEKTKGEKGVGIHLDIVLLSLINMLSAFFGGPWICAATVRAVSHVSALVVMSTNVIPGESPKVVGVRDQRVSALVVSILLGASVLMAPILKQVPFAVLFGVFLYMGVSGMNGVQFFDRVRLAVMPVKHHPQVTYVKKVKTWRMLLFTGLQALGLVILWVVKSTPAALAFPFFVVAMIPYRHLLKFIFTSNELDALDGPSAGKDLSGEVDEEADFFEAAADCPIAPTTSAPLHRTMMALVNVPGLGIKLPEPDINGKAK